MGRRAVNVSEAGDTTINGSHWQVRGQSRSITCEGVGLDSTEQRAAAGGEAGGVREDLLAVTRVSRWDVQMWVEVMIGGGRRRGRRRSTNGFWRREGGRRGRADYN